MRILRKTNVLVKTERKIFVRRQIFEENIFCERCQKQMMQAQTSADLLGISIREVYRLIESGKIHFVETDANEVYVCPISVEQKGGNTHEVSVFGVEPFS